MCLRPALLERRCRTTVTLRRLRLLAAALTTVSALAILAVAAFRPSFRGLGRPEIPVLVSLGMDETAVYDMATGERIGVPTVRSDREGADPASVAFEAVTAGVELESDVVIIDARKDLVGARSLTQLLRATGLSAPLMLVLTEGGMAAVYQAYEARLWGADCILVIMASVTDAEVSPARRGVVPERNVSRASSPRTITHPGLGRSSPDLSTPVRKTVRGHAA